MSEVQVRAGESDDPLARYWSVAVSGVAALALVLRLPWPPPWWLNPDEGIYFSAVADPSFGDFWAEALATAHPPLYFLILRGVAALSTDFGSLRAVALVCGIASVLAVIVLGRELGGSGTRGRVAGLGAGLLIAASPRMTILSQLIRPYTLLLLLLAVALLGFLRYVRLGSRAWLTVYAVSVTLALTLHYSAVGALGVFAALVVSDGLRHGVRRPEWRRLAWAQLAPVVTLALLYVFHLRGLMASTMAGWTLEGWLSPFLIRRPVDAWVGLVGIHSSLVGDTLAVPAALLTLLGLAWAGWTRRWSVLVAGGSALVIATIGAAAGKYPFGETRHATWLLTFVTPALAWAVASALVPEPLEWPPRFRAAIPALLLAGLLVGAGPVTSGLGPDRRPREIAELVLRTGNMEAMADVLDPEKGPRLVVMSLETYTLLSPLFVAHKDAARTTDGGLQHVPWGRRDVLVVADREIAALPDQSEASNHLHRVIRRASETLGVDALGEGERVLVLDGGWRSQGLVDLIGMARGVPDLGSVTYVPGLIAVELDFDAYRRALGAMP